MMMTHVGASLSLEKSLYCPTAHSSAYSGKSVYLISEVKTRTRKTCDFCAASRCSKILGLVCFKKELSSDRHFNPFTYEIVIKMQWFEILWEPSLLECIFYSCY